MVLNMLINFKKIFQRCKKKDYFCWKLKNEKERCKSLYDILE